MGAHDGAVDHRVFVIAVSRQHLKQLFPHATLGPAGKSRVNLYRIAKALRQVSPGNAGAIPLEHGFHKQPVILGRDPDMAGAARQYILDPSPLIISQSIASHRPAPEN